MNINTIDDLLSYIHKNTLYAVNKETTSEVQKIIDAACNYDLLITTPRGNFKLSQKGNDVFESHLGWVAYKNKITKSHFEQAQDYYFKQAIDDATIAKTGRHYFPRPILCPAAPVQKISLWKRLLSFQDKPIAQQRAAFWASIAAIVTVIAAVIIWLKDMLS